MVTRTQVQQDHIDRTRAAFIKAEADIAADRFTTERALKERERRRMEGVYRLFATARSVGVRTTWLAKEVLGQSGTVKATAFVKEGEALFDQVAESVDVVTEEPAAEPVRWTNFRVSDEGGILATFDYIAPNGYVLPAILLDGGDVDFEQKVWDEPAENEANTQAMRAFQDDAQAIAEWAERRRSAEVGE